MTPQDAIRCSINGGEMIVQAYLKDLRDADLLVRPVSGCNHIAWQLGHLIYAERFMVELCVPGSMPELPAGFAEKHAKGASGSDNPGDFLTKAEYLELFSQVRAATHAALSRVSDADLDRPAPPPLDSYLKTVADAFSMQGTHWVMHAGQWAVIRRKLGKPPLF